MVYSPNELFVIEQAARQASAQQAKQPGCAGILMALLEFITRRRPPLGPATVLIPPAPSVYGYDTALRLDDRHDTGAVGRSIGALEEYRAAYKEYDNRPLAPRSRQARITGMPALLTGYFDQNPPFEDLQSAVDFALRWLSEGLRRVILFGVDGPTADLPTLQLSDVVYFGRETESDSTGGVTAHIRFQQMHQQWPVFGGESTVHLRLHDTRAWVSNSYFPLKPDATFAARLSQEDAKWLAQKVLAGYLTGLPCISLWWGMLQVWLKGSDIYKGQAPESSAWYTRVAELFTQDLAEYSATHDHALPDAERLAAAKTRSNQEALLAALPDAQKWLRQFEWRITVVPCADSALFIFPFAGHYHLAYQIELSAPALNQFWRVFVDAEAGDVLGKPESRLAHALYYDKSGDVLLPTPQTSSVDPQQLGDKVQSFMRMQFGSDGRSLEPKAIDGDPALSPQQKLEAFTIAVSAKKLFEHFKDTCGAPKEKINFPAYGGGDHQGLQINFGLTAEGDPLQTFFNPASDLDPKRITFQSGNANTEGKTIKNPSQDPELTIHEFAHGFMWLLNRSPFDQQGASVPFARALLEGYATYFARSLAARTDNEPPPVNDDEPPKVIGPGQHWARAAYRTGPVDSGEWGDEWALTRPIPSDASIRADRLPALNLYPDRQTEGLPVYDVGMIWARALWDVRELLRNDNNGGIDQADRLALIAHQGLNGYVSSFEIAAEGVIIEAQTEMNRASNDPLLISIKNAFAARGILAERGVQALARAQNGDLVVGTDGGVVVGTDAAVRQSTTNDNPWSDWDSPALGSKKGVVALAVDGPKVYAATESNIYERNIMQNGSWSPVSFPNAVSPKEPVWRATETPLSLLVVDGTLYVGTGDNVWEFDQGWGTWGDLARPARQLADVAVASDNDTLLRSRYAALIGGVVARKDGDTDADWITPDPFTIRDALVTTVTAQGNTLYAGTLNSGIWHQIGNSVNSRMTFGAWEHIVDIQSLGGGAVLCLAVNGNGNLLYAGTTAGLYQVDLPPANPAIVAQVTMNPPDPIVTCILPVGTNMLLVGTAAQGLFVGQSTAPQDPAQWGWTQFDWIGT